MRSLYSMLAALALVGLPCVTALATEAPIVAEYTCFVPDGRSCLEAAGNGTSNTTEVRTGVVIPHLAGPVEVTFKNLKDTRLVMELVYPNGLVIENISFKTIRKPQDYGNNRSTRRMVCPPKKTCQVKLSNLQSYVDARVVEKK